MEKSSYTYLDNASLAHLKIHFQKTSFPPKNGLNMNNLQGKFRCDLFYPVHL